jgi:hypothetical protein
MMKKFGKYVGAAAVLLLVVSCFLPWYRLEWKDVTVSGMDAAHFGKPAYWHFVFAFFFLLFHFIPRVWAKQWNVFMAAINCAWTARNFFAMAICSGGECPERQAGIWLLVLASLLMLAASLFPNVPLPQEKNKFQR